MRSTLERSRGLRLPRGPLGPPGASGYSRGPLGPPGASGYSRGPLWGLLGPPVTPGALSLPAKPIWRWCGSVRVGAPLGSAGKKRAAPRALLPVDAGPRGGERRRPRGGRATAPWACPSLNIVKNRVGVSWNLHCGCGIVRSTLERSRGLRLLPGPSGASWGLRLLPGPSGASWGLRLLPGPSGASWGLRLLPGALSLPAKPIWRWCGSVRVGAPLGSAGKKRAAPRALLPVDAGPRGGERRRPRGGRATAPWACPFSQHREKSGGGLLNLHCGCGIVRSTLERSRGLRLLPGPSGASWGLRLLPGPWGLLGPPVTPGALWGLLGPPVTPGGPFTPC